MPTDYAEAEREAPETETAESDSNADTVLVDKAALAGATSGRWELVHEYEDEAAIRLVTDGTRHDDGSMESSERDLEMMAE